MTQPVIIPAGHELLAPDFDAYENLTGAWAAYTPVWTTGGTAPALGNGSLVGNFFQAGMLVHVRIVLTMGTTTTFGTSTYRLSLPVTPKAHSLLVAACEDASASARWAGQAWIIAQSATGDNMRIMMPPNNNPVTNTVPFTWASADKLILAGSYEAA